MWILGLKGLTELENFSVKICLRNSILLPQQVAQIEFDFKRVVLVIKFCGGNISSPKFSSTH